MSLAVQTDHQLQRARGTGRIAAGWRESTTRLDTLFEEGCAKIRLPRTHDDSVQAVLINSAGGLTGGDRIDWRADATAGARLVLTTQACERIYRSLGSDAELMTRITVGAGARLDWLPQETILFQGARLRRRLEVDLAPDARFTTIEAVIIGREAMGEDARDLRFADSWRIRVDGRLLHAEQTRLRGEDRERDSLGLLEANRAFATILHIAPDAGRRLDDVRALLPDDARAAASLIGNRLIVRAMAPSGIALRRAIAPALALLSGAGALPRLWHL